MFASRLNTFGFAGLLFLTALRAPALEPTDHWLSWFGFQDWQVVFDQDGDGFTAEEEFNWGTEPLNAGSIPYLFSTVSNRYYLHVAATPEVLSLFESTTDFLTWEPVTNLPPATNWMIVLEIPRDEPHRFYRIGAPVHANSDGDCLYDFEELTLYGTNPLLTDTDGDGLDDCAEVNVYHTNPNYSSPFGRGAITGKVVLDEDSDPATQDHPGLAGWKVFADLDYDGELDFSEPVAETQADGTYVIAELDPGLYRVCVESRPAWVQVFPASSPPTTPDGYADRVVGFFDSGRGITNFPCGRYADPLPGLRLVFPIPPLVPVDPKIILGALPPPPIAGPFGGWWHVDIVSIPQDSWLTVAFDGEEIIDGPGADLTIVQAQGGSVDTAQLFLGSTESNLTSAGVIAQAEVVSIDLATLNVPKPVRYLKMLALSNGGAYPGWDLVGFEALNFRPQSRSHYEVAVVGGMTVSNINFGVIGNDRPPKVFITTDTQDVRAGETLTAQVTASDDLGISSVTLTANGVAVPLNAQLQGTITVMSGGLLEVAATATDTTNQQTRTLLTLITRNADGSLPDLSGLGATDGSGTGGASIQVISPVPGEILTTARTITGTIAGTTDGVASWQVHYALADLVNPEALDAPDSDYILLQEGTGPVLNGSLGTFPGDTLAAGAYFIRVNAADMLGVTRYLGFVIGVNIDPLDIRPDIVITKPTNETTITFMTNVIGNITTRQQLREWYVEYAPLSQVNLQNLSDNTPAWTRIASGTNPMVNGVLAKFDATLVPNDSYVVRVSAWNRNGLGWTEPVVVHVTGNAKLGNFAVEYTDVNIPLAGIPITVKRRYDSLNATRSGDFGYGWSLGVQDADIAETVPQTGSGFTSTPFKVGTRVYLTAPDGQRIGFTFEPEVGAVSFLGAAYSAVFKPDPGITYTLSVPEDETAFLTVNSAGETFLFFVTLPWNPDTYILTDKEGTRYTYDQHDGLMEIADANDNRVTFSDNAIEHSAGPRIDLTRDGSGRITQIAAPEAQTWSYEYDAAGDLVEVTYPGNIVATFSYTTNRPHFLETINDPLTGPTQRTEYDENGRVVAIIDAAGNRREQTWDPGSFTGTYTDGRSNVTKLVYDARGNITRSEDPLGGVTTWEYKNTNFPDFETAIVDPRGNRITFTYDERGNLLQAAAPLSKRTTYTYDENDRVLTKYYNLGGTDEFEYDANGNMTHFDSPLGEWTLTYTSGGLLASVLDGAGGLTRVEYDGSLGVLSRIIDPNGGVKQFGYDPYGRLIQYTDPLNNITRFEYDSAGRPARQIDPNDGETVTTYDPLFADKPRTVTDRAGRVTQYQYDTLGRLQQVTAPGGAITRYEYDVDGNRTAVIDPVTNRYEFKYDAMSRLIEETDPLGQKRFHSYDLAGNRTNSVDRNGRRRAFVYDARNRVTQERWHDPTSDAVVRTITYGYDVLDRVNSASDPDATVRPVWVRVPGDRKENERVTYPGRSDFSVSYSYDRAGKRVGLTSAILTHGALNLDYVRDSAGYLRILISRAPLPPSTVTNNARQVQFWRNARGDVTDLRRFSDQNGVNQVSQTFFTNSAACGCLANSIMHVVRTNQPLPDASMTFTRDLEGSITGLLEGTNNFAYWYDAAGQLTNVIANGATAENYAYDGNGNRLASHRHTSYITGPANRLMQAGAWVLSYDGEGNLITKLNTVTGDVFTFTWDHRSRLTQVTKTNFSTLAGFVTGFRYDPFDRRVAVIGAGVTNWTYYDGDQPIADYVNNETSPIGLAGAGEKLDELYAVWTRGEGTYWTLNDHLGSVRRVLDRTGVEVAALANDAYGNPSPATGSKPNAAGRFGFTGREWDLDGGLYYYRTRYYDPDMGRFISPDTLGFEGGDANLYRYVFNNPLNGVDPTGEAVSIEYAINVAGVACTVAGAIFIAYPIAAELYQTFEEISFALDRGGPSTTFDPFGAAKGLAGNPLNGFFCGAPVLK